MIGLVGYSPGASTRLSIINKYVPHRPAPGSQVEKRNLIVHIVPTAYGIKESDATLTNISHKIPSRARVFLNEVIDCTIKRATSSNTQQELVFFF